MLDDLQMIFQHLTISYNGEVLEPRPWTAAQAAWAAELIDDAPEGPVLELCAGVGHIGLGAVQNSARKLVMVDFNPVAQRYAQHNAAVNGLAAQVEFRLARMEEALAATEYFGLIIADPPWVPSHETSKFPADPLNAIDGGDDGLELARLCIDLMYQHLADGGTALLQLGNIEQVDQISAYAAQQHMGSIRVVETRSFDDGVLVRLVR